MSSTLKLFNIIQILVSLVLFQVSLLIQPDNSDWPKQPKAIK